MGEYIYRYIYLYSFGPQTSATPATPIASPQPGAAPTDAWGTVSGADDAGGVPGAIFDVRGRIAEPLLCRLGPF